MFLPLGDSVRTQTLPLATYLLIAANVVMFVLQQERGPTFTTSFAATPFEITHDEDIDHPFLLPVPATDPRDGRPTLAHTEIMQGPVPFPVWMTLLTAMFLHGDLMHLAGNMLFLWIFGDNVEEVLGSVRYVIIYVCCGLAASLAQMAAHPDSYIPTLGASGAVAGMMGAYLVWFPHHGVRVLLLQVLVELPAVVVIGFWVLVQIWLGFGSIGRLGQAGGVAYLAHVGGAVAGIAIGVVFQDRARAIAWEHDSSPY